MEQQSITEQNPQDQAEAADGLAEQQDVGADVAGTGADSSLLDINEEQLSNVLAQSNLRPNPAEDLEHSDADRNRATIDQLKKLSSSNPPGRKESVTTSSRRRATPPLASRKRIMARH